MKLRLLGINLIFLRIHFNILNLSLTIHLYILSYYDYIVILSEQLVIKNGVMHILRSYILYYRDGTESHVSVAFLKPLPLTTNVSRKIDN